MATALIPGSQLAERLTVAVPEAVTEVEDGCVYVQADRLLESAHFLHDDTELDGRYLIAVSGVDRYDRFEVVYHIASLSHNHQFVLKVRADHDNPEVPSVASVWLGAQLQEREAFDLLGIRFSGHSDLKRLFLWEGFPGHPLRKDYMSLPGGFSPGLRRFPKEKTDEWGGEFRAD